VVYFGPTDPKQQKISVQLDHNRDGLSYLCCAISSSEVEGEDNNEDELYEALGWVAVAEPDEPAGWKPPWQH
jgi:hypothetical protein